MSGAVCVGERWQESGLTKGLARGVAVRIDGGGFNICIVL